MKIVCTEYEVDQWDIVYSLLGGFKRRKLENADFK